MDAATLDCPCGYPDFRVEVTISALVTLDRDGVALNIEGDFTYPRVADVYCINCGQRTVTEDLHTGSAHSHHQDVVRHAVECLEDADVVVALGEWS